MNQPPRAFASIQSMNFTSTSSGMWWATSELTTKSIFSAGA